MISKRGRVITMGNLSIRVANDKEVMSDLVKLAQMGSDEYYVEIGTAAGKSLTAVYEKNPNIQLISIDPAPKQPPVEYYKNVPNVRLLKVKSDRGYKVLRKEEIKPTCVFIDGDHTETWVQKDIRNFWELWNKQGFFGGHDYTRRPEKNWGVMPAVREFFDFETDCVINRRMRCNGGTMHILDTFWFFIHDDAMHKYEDYLKDL